MTKKFSISIKDAQEYVADMMEVNEVTDKVAYAKSLLRDIEGDIGVKGAEGEVADYAFTLACIGIVLNDTYAKML